MTVDAVLFDLDGVIVDTEPLHHRAFDQVLEEEDEPPIDAREYGREFSSGGRGREWLAERFDAARVDRIVERKKTVYRALLEAEMQLRDGAADAVRRLAAAWPLALATNSPRSEGELVLERFDLARHFRVVIGREDYAAPKPAPDPFLVAARRLGAAPGRCVVVEDAWKGVEAARRGGMRAVAVPGAYTIETDFGSDVVVLASMDELDAPAIERAMACAGSSTGC